MPGKSEMPPEVRAYFVKQGKKGGRLGGPQTGKNLTAEELAERCRNAGIASGKARKKAALAKKKEAAAAARAAAKG